MSSVVSCSVCILYPFLCTYAWNILCPGVPVPLQANHLSPQQAMGDRDKHVGHGELQVFLIIIIFFFFFMSSIIQVLLYRSSRCIPHFRFFNRSSPTSPIQKPPFDGSNPTTELLDILLIEIERQTHNPSAIATPDHNPSSCQCKPNAVPKLIGIATT